jgi:arginyl-tRNA synthetase
MQELQEIIKKSVKELFDIGVPTFTVDFPTDLQFGDLTTNVAMTIAKNLKKNPAEIASTLAGHIKVHAPKSFTDQFHTVTSVGGFINFTFTKDTLWEQLLRKQFTQIPAVSEQKRIMVEYGDPNTHKLLHIGHLFSYIVGESFARLLDAVGNTVVKANYQGDIGPHVAKALYGYIQIGQPKPTDSLERVQLLQKCYQEGVKAYEEDPVAKETIDGITRKLYSKDPEIVDLWKETRQWSVDYYHEFEQRLDIQQTYHYWESEIWEQGKKNVEDHIGTIFEKSDGAIVFPGEKHGLHTRVFITKNDTPTYEAKDMGLNVQKYSDWPYDLNLITTANEQNSYFDVMIKALDLCFPELAGRTKHIGYGLVSLSTGKMSSRTGEMISAIDLVETVKKRVVDLLKEREGLEENEKNAIAEKVTMAAIKFAFLRQNILQNMKFDIEESIKFEGRSGPYIQYTYARIQSIVRQLELPEATSKDGMQLEKKEELELLRWLSRFPTVISQAAQALAPHVVAEYTFQTAQLFNSFYAECPINTEKNSELQRARRTLAVSTAEVLKKGLNLLGVDIVEKM